MASCLPGCTCGRHKPSLKRGVPISPEQSKKLSAAQIGRVPWNKGVLGAGARIKRTLETRRRMSLAMRGLKRTDTSKIKEVAQRNAAHVPHKFRGGRIADDFARTLCSAGFVREHVVMWGSGCNDRFRLDFAHISTRIAVELDGPSHNNPEQIKIDDIRNRFLREAGWIVLHLKHDGKEIISGVKTD